MKIKISIKKLLPSFLIDFYHYFFALISAIVFLFPSRQWRGSPFWAARRLIVIGITGTSGKSTTVDFITRILEEAGNKVVSNSSIRFKAGKKEWPNNIKMGMPGRFFMQKLLRQGVKEKCKYAVLEVTSEGIKQYRHKFIHFNTAVFTNLTPEHIESHGGFENYRNEKLKLFKATKNMHIINADDENSDYFTKIPSSKKYFFGIKDTLIIDGRRLLEYDVKAKNIINNSDGIKFEVRGTKFHLNLLGEFNVYNALAAISVALSEGISLQIAKKALEKVKSIPGRMEVVIKSPFTVIVDYAHTPEQLESVYKTLSQNPKSQIPNPKQVQNPNIQNSKLICVLGSCGGGRDKWKRPVLGQIAKKYCKEIIITNEDPYDENPAEIIDQVAQGAGPDAKKILDRREAIKNALKLAKLNDVVIITGKGSELWMCVADGKKIPWNDKEIIKKELQKQ